MFQTSGIKQDIRDAENMARWTKALKGYNSLMDVDNTNRMVILYSNEILFKRKSATIIRASEAGILESPSPTRKWKFAHLGTQTGRKVFLLQAYKLD